jgi:hypothetical protein
VTDVTTAESDAIEGGLLQRIHEEKIRSDPDTVGLKMPAVKSDKKTREEKKAAIKK